MTKVVMASLSGRGDKSTLRMTKVVMASLSGRGDTRSFANAQDDKSTHRRTSLRTGGQAFVRDDRGVRLCGLYSSFEGRNLFICRSPIDRVHLLGIVLLVGL